MFDCFGLFQLIKGCNPFVRNINRETPFHLAALEGHMNILKLFLKLGESFQSWTSNVICTLCESTVLSDPKLPFVQPIQGLLFSIVTTRSPPFFHWESITVCPDDFEFLTLKLCTHFFWCICWPYNINRVPIKAKTLMKKNLEIWLPSWGTSSINKLNLFSFQFRIQTFLRRNWWQTATTRGTLAFTWRRRTATSRWTIPILVATAVFIKTFTLKFHVSLPFSFRFAHAFKKSLFTFELSNEKGVLGVFFFLAKMSYKQRRVRNRPFAQL